MFGILTCMRAFIPNLRDTKPYNVVLWTNIISSTFALDFYCIMIKYKVYGKEEFYYGESQQFAFSRSDGNY